MIRQRPRSSPHAVRWRPCQSGGPSLLPLVTLLRTGDSIASFSCAGCFHPMRLIGSIAVSNVTVFCRIRRREPGPECTFLDGRRRGSQLGAYYCKKPGQDLIVERPVFAAGQQEEAAPRAEHLASARSSIAIVLANRRATFCCRGGSRCLLEHECEGDER